MHLVDAVHQVESVFEILAILALLHRQPFRHLHPRPDWQFSERNRGHGSRGCVGVVLRHRRRKCVQCSAKNSAQVGDVRSAENRVSIDVEHCWRNQRRSATENLLVTACIYVLEMHPYHTFHVGV